MGEYRAARQEGILEWVIIVLAGSGSAADGGADPAANLTT